MSDKIFVLLVARLCLERDEKTQTDRIVLINIGTHDEVY